jgi:serine/threonine-protein kinase
MSAPDPNIGRDILDGQFQILQKIGSGGMGSVYKAAQPAMNRLVAVKILHPKLTNRKDLASRFRREARAMSHLEHPNTVKVLLYGELDDGALYIVMEYLEGKNLNQVVRKEGPLAPERAIPVLIQVCGALQEAHLQGIVHRDLKPENIFLSTNGGLRDYPKVLDFGLAKVTERELRPGSIMLTQEGMVFGTPEFMSPEQAQGKTLDARSDVYSLAVILYEVLTGKLPFDAKQPMEYIQAHVTKAPIPLDERVPGKKFPAGLGAAILHALEKAPDRRYASAAEFAQALKPFAGAAGKGFSGMMPRPEGVDLSGSPEELPVVPIEPSKPSVPIRPPRSSIPKTVRMEPGEAQAFVAGGGIAGGIGGTTPEGKVPVAALAAEAARRRTRPTWLMLAGIAASCLVAGIVITMLILKLIPG